MMKKAVLFLISVGIVLLTFSITVAATDVLTFEPRFIQAPESPPWYTHGEVAFSDGVMKIINGATDDYSAGEGFVFATLGLNMSPIRNVVELSADVMIPSSSSSEPANDLTGATLGINVTRTLANGDNIQMRLVLNHGYGGTPFLESKVFNHDSNNVVTELDTGPQQLSSLDVFYKLKISIDDNNTVIFSVDGNPIRTWEFPYEGPFETAAFVWGFNYFNDDNTNRDIEGQVKNVQVKFEPIGTPTFSFEIPSGEITVDGTGTDWTGISPIIEDKQNDTACGDDGEGSDLKAVYLAKDDQYLYWRIDTWSGAFQFEEGEFGRGPGIVFYEPSGLRGIEHSIMGGPNNWSINKRYSSEGNWVNLINNYNNLNSDEYGEIGIVARGENVAEGKIPLGLFSDLDINFILAWYHEGTANVLCDEASRTFFLPSKINFALLYSDNRLYDPKRFDWLPESHPSYEGHSFWFMQALAVTSGDQSHPVYLDLDSGTSPPVELEYWGEWPGLGSFNVRSFIGESNGGDFYDPGSDWENTTYTFSVGNQTWPWHIPGGSLEQLSIPIATISGTTDPTIEWNSVDGADYYRVSIYPLIYNQSFGCYYPDWQNPALFDSDEIYGTSYTYTGDIFKDGGEYAIFIQARQTHLNMEKLWINRSTYVTTHSTFSVDIKPGSCTNPLNVKSKGVLPVAVLGSKWFDVTDINPKNVMLEGVKALRSSVEDVGSQLDCDGSQPDGFDDLILQFSTEEIAQALGEVNDGEEVPLTLTGALKDGTERKGEDTVVILNKVKKGK